MTSDSGIQLVAVADLTEEAEMHTDRLAELVQSRHPDVDVERFGATAWPDGVTKGDIDVLVRVPAGDSGDVLATLRARMRVAQGGNWTATFAAGGIGVDLMALSGREVVGGLQHSSTEFNGPGLGSGGVIDMADRSQVRGFGTSS